MGEIAVALPKGRLLSPTAGMLKDWGLSGYAHFSRNYCPSSAKFPGIRFKVFQERDIPIQVSVGNYDLGICGLHWVDELLTKYPESPVIKVRQFDYGGGHLYLACHKSFPASSLDQLKGNKLGLRLASEYPNLLEAWALMLRLRYFRLLPIHGSAYVYPPEDADLVLLTASSEQELEKAGLKVLGKTTATNACLIANRESWQRKEMGELVKAFLEAEFKPAEDEGFELSLGFPRRAPIRLALPDGHQKRGTVEFLRERGLKVEEYKEGNRRPDLGIDWLAAKVIRPQDMPMQVACGNFDLAITGKDLFFEHICRFPSSPIEKIADFDYGRVRVVAAVHETFPAASPSDLRRYLERHNRPIKVVSEYINLADQYCRENHLSPYRLIPTWGAGEAFLPEDGELLIENTETGKTLAEHHLRIIDIFFESTACLIVNRELMQGKKEYFEPLLKILLPGDKPAV